MNLNIHHHCCCSDVAVAVVGVEVEIVESDHDPGLQEEEAHPVHLEEGESFKVLLSTHSCH